jgi:hypothetical protein
MSLVKKFRDGPKALSRRHPGDFGGSARRGPERSPGRSPGRGRVGAGEDEIRIRGGVSPGVREAVPGKGLARGPALSSLAFPGRLPLSPAFSPRPTRGTLSGRPRAPLRSPSFPSLPFVSFRPILDFRAQT